MESHGLRWIVLGSERRRIIDPGSGILPFNRKDTAVCPTFKVEPEIGACTETHIIAVCRLVHNGEKKMGAPPVVRRVETEGTRHGLRGRGNKSSWPSVGTSRRSRQGRPGLFGKVVRCPMKPSESGLSVADIANGPARLPLIAHMPGDRSTTKKGRTCRRVMLWLLLAELCR